jgi:hypothetical protein
MPSQKVHTGSDDARLRTVTEDRLDLAGTPTNHGEERNGPSEERHDPAASPSMSGERSQINAARQISERTGATEGTHRLDLTGTDSNSEESSPAESDTQTATQPEGARRRIQPPRTQRPRNEWSGNIRALSAIVAYSAVAIPKTVMEAMESNEADRWIEACHAELASHRMNKTWTLVDLPKGRKPIESKWVFALKQDANGNIERYKARLCAKGFGQIAGVDTSKHSHLSLVLPQFEWC